MTKFPTDSKDLQAVDTAEKAKTCKKELKEKFKNHKFKRRTKRYAGGSSFTVYVVTDTTEDEREEMEEIVNKYQYVYDDHNPQFDHFHVDNYAFIKFGNSYKYI